jgi:hypothetical protein
MRFVTVFMLAATADFLWASYTSAVSGKQAVRAAAWSMAIAVVSGVIAIHYVHAPVQLVSLASGSFVGTYLCVNPLSRLSRLMALTTIRFVVSQGCL